MLLETFFPYRLAISAEAFSRKLVEVYGHQFGLSREEWRLLLLLGKGGDITSLELARRTSLDKVQISRAAQKLASKSLITREVFAQDKRLRMFACTPSGQTLIDQVFPEVEARANEILDRIPAKDRAALDQGLAALAKAVADHGATTD